MQLEESWHCAPRQPALAPEEVEAKIISVDRKSRVIQLSIKSKDDAEEKEAIQSLRDKPATSEPSAGPTTLGDLLRAQMEKQN